MTKKQEYEKQRIEELKKKKRFIEETAIFIEDWEALSKIPKESDTHILKIDVEGCNGWITLKNGKGCPRYLSTHTFYGMTHAESTAVLRECGFNVTINNWDKEEEY